MLRFQKVANSADAAARFNLALDLQSADIPDHFRCSVCLKVPKQEILQCAEGHIVCKDCCRAWCSRCNRCMPVNYAGSPVRCRALEGILDSLLIACPFKAKGCLETALGRAKIISHADGCAFNGGTFRLCSKLGFQGSCNYLVETTRPLEIFKHLKTEHQLQTFQVYYGREYPKLMMIPEDVFSYEETAPFAPCQPIHLKSYNAQVLAGLLINPLDRTMSAFGLRIDTEKEQGSSIEVEFKIKKTKKMPGIKWKVPVTSILSFTGTLQQPPVKHSMELLKNYCLSKRGRLDIDISLIPSYAV